MVFAAEVVKLYRWEMSAFSRKMVQPPPRTYR
jgi:hypothetical protein